jgi:hypothetical protein
MTNRYQKRKAARLAASIVTKAKKDMIAWFGSLEHTPTETEMIAWQAGYVAGVNRLATEKEQEND